MPVTFHTEKTKFDLKQKLQHKRWIKLWIESQGAVCGNISFIFTSNTRLRSINQEYLNHNYYTDVITFDYTEGETIAGDVFISIDQVKINAENYDTDPGEELRRVMIHGVIHLLGYKDGNDEERRCMRQMENEALHLWLKMV
ncbi:MAG: rRNA maturation RNase YbeY [Bacteroidota bacterium]|nr:rRNA maturation RNase YbeY [Bacteroidota bacterium]